MAGGCSISEFFANKNVFVTGGSGFVGSVLIESLLSASNKLGKIYVLYRDKNGVSAKDRLKAMLNSELFASHAADSLSKIIEVEGNICQPGLGLRFETRAILESRVHVVFHAAAVINFNASLKSAISTNLLGTLNVVTICKQMRNIKALVYISTSYCNCPEPGLIEEKIYLPLHDPYEIIEMADKPEVNDEVLSALLGSHPNAYTFTKQLSERLLQLERDFLRIAIVRPSIVLGTSEKPVEGFIDNVINNGACGFIAGCIKGFFRTISADPAFIIDVTPCDYVVSMCLAAAKEVGVAESKDIQVYHCTSGESNPLSWGRYVSLVVNAARRYPSCFLFWYPNAKARISLTRNTIVLLLCHYIPAYVLLGLQTFTRFNEGNPTFLSLQQKYTRGLSATQFFTSREFRFSTNISERLADNLHPDDRELYRFDPSTIDWESFIEKCVKGIQRYYFKEPLDKHGDMLRRFKLLHITCYVMAFIIIGFLLVLGFSFCFGLGPSSSATVLSSYVISAILVFLFYWI